MHIEGVGFIRESTPDEQVLGATMRQALGWVPPSPCATPARPATPAVVAAPPRRPVGMRHSASCPECEACKIRLFLSVSMQPVSPSCQRRNRSTVCAAVVSGHILRFFRAFGAVAKKHEGA
eukprot:352890-Chlamydomonas_euryale.AAC.3